MVNNLNGSKTWQSQIPANAPNGTDYLIVNNFSTGAQIVFAPYSVPGPSLAATEIAFYQGNSTFLIRTSGLGFHALSPISFSAVTGYNSSPRVTWTTGPQCNATEYGNFTSCVIHVTAGGWGQGGWRDVSMTITASDNQAQHLTTFFNVTVGNKPTGVAVNPLTGFFYVTNYNDGTVAVVSNATFAVVARISVGSCPSGIAFDAARGEMFVANSCAGTLSVINTTTNTVIGTVEVGTSPGGVAYDQAKNVVLVTNYGSNTVSVINDLNNQIVATVHVGVHPSGVTYQHSGKAVAYVANKGSNNVSEISMTTYSVLRSIQVGNAPSAIAYAFGAGEIAVTNSGSSTVSVINDTSQGIVATISVGAQSNGVAYDGVDHLWLVTSQSSNSLYVANATTNQVTTVLGTGTSPVGVAYSSGSIVVTNSGSSSITIVKWTYQATTTIWVGVP